MKTSQSNGMESEKGPSLEGWMKISESTGIWGAQYGIYVSPDGSQMAEKDEEDGETAIVFNRKTWVITYVHPKTSEGAKIAGLKLEAGMSYMKVIEEWLNKSRRPLTPR
jgi:hypothetical protein